MVRGHAPICVCGSTPCDGIGSVKMHEPIAYRLADISDAHNSVISFIC